jgi:hypothetical protein
MNASAPQPLRPAPPGEWKHSPPRAAEFVICDCTIEQFFKDSKQLLGLGHYQNRSYGAAVIHLHLVCFAYALLTHLRIARPGAQGQRTRHKAAEVSTSMVQNQLRGLLWDDLLTYLKENCHAESVLTELERLRVA